MTITTKSLQVKISTQHPEVLASACENFLKKEQHQLESLITETLEGHQRGIMGSMTVEVYSNICIGIVFSYLFWSSIIHYSVPHLKCLFCSCYASVYSCLWPFMWIILYCSSSITMYPGGYVIISKGAFFSDLNNIFFCLLCTQTFRTVLFMSI